MNSNTGLTVPQTQALSTHSGEAFLAADKLRMLGDTIMKDASAEELEFFGEVCKRTGLDPFRRQIHAVSRWNADLKRNVWTFQTGVDGLRAIAHRTKQCAGIDDAIFVPADESTPYPSRATVTVWRLINGVRTPFTATARWNEYVQTKRDGSVVNMWHTKPYGQLAKCAECLALRKAFPEDLSGLHGDEEMQQASNPQQDAPSAYRLPELDDAPAATPEPAKRQPERAAPIEAEVLPPAGSAAKPLSAVPTLAVPDAIEPFTGGRWKSFEIPEGGLLGKKKWAMITKLRETLPEPLRWPLLATYVDEILAVLSAASITEDDFAAMAYDAPELDLSFPEDLWMAPQFYPSLLKLAQSLKAAP